MFPLLTELNGSEDSISSRNRIRTKVWGISLGNVVKPVNAYTTEKERHALETGQKSKLKLKKKFYITQAVLDPESDPDIPYDTKFVQVMLQHNQLEHILAVLKHGEIYQTNLNVRFDRDDITLYIKGKGTVHLLGYEILSEDDEKEEEKESEEELESKTSSNGAETFEKPSKSGKKHKSAKLGTEKKSAETFSDVISKRLKKNKSAEPEMSSEDESDDDASPNHMKLLETEFSSEDDEDEDFSLSEEETDDEMQQEEESEDDEEDVDVNELSKLLSDPDEADSDEDSRDQPGPSCSQKRKKRPIKEKSQKRSRQEESPKPGSSKISEDKNQKDSSSTDDSSDNVPPKPPVVKKKGKTDANQAPKLTRTERIEASKRILEGGVETRDLKPGHGPVATKGKMLHVYYIGRLANKSIFDSVIGPEKRPFSFKLGEKKVIRGWEIGLEGMKAGGKRIIKVPPKMGYGNKHLGGIPANSTLTFVVELQAVT